MTIFEKVCENVTMKDIVEYYTNNKVIKGKTFCVFHNDVRTPDFDMNKDKNYGHCHACNWHGSIFDFVKCLYDNLENTHEACIKIIEDFNLNVDYNKKLSKKEINIYFRKKEIEKKLNNYISKKYHKYSRIFRNTRFWLLSNDNIKFTIDYQFVLFLNDISNKFCDYFNKLENNIEKKIDLCYIIDKHIKLKWHEFYKILNNSLEGEWIKPFKSQEIVDLYDKIIG